MSPSREEFTPLPKFSVPPTRGGNYSLSMKPPFSFSGVTNLVFPLRASLDSLQRFCNNYLNIIPPEIGRFRAPFPYVYLMLLDYGRMAIDVANVGWLSQREVFFCVPLEWYRVVNGQWVFHDWASICPFIYVDDTMSLNVGRSVYGWPKTLVKMKPTVSDWMTDPLAPVDEATLSTMVFPRLYAGDRLEERVFLQVERKRSPSNARLPLDPSNAFAPWSIATNMANAAAGFGRDFVGMLAGLGLAPMHAGSTGDNYMSMIMKLNASGFALRPDVVANTINLKQFRRSERPEEFCYQALTNGPMRYTALNRAGLLGQDRLLLGDTTAGYSIKLHEWPSLPIVETLGLEVARKVRGQETTVVELDPVVPFWYDVNMSYEPGYNVASRSRDGIWHDQHGAPYAEHAHYRANPKLFNTTLGAGNKAVAGPFHFSGTTIRVLPLLARAESLTSFVDNYLNHPLRDGNANARFSLWSAPTTVDGQDRPSAYSYVYLTATTFDDVTSGTDNIGDWADAEVAFLVPVRFEERTDEHSEWRVSGVGVLPAFTYLDSVTAASARSEVLGIPSIVADFGKPESAWMAEDGDGAEAGARQVLLRVDVEVLPAVGEGQKSERRTILDIVSGSIAEESDALEWRETADRWGAILKKELERKKHTRTDAAARMDVADYDPVDVPRALALEILSNRAPISLYTLKQFRDVADADLACYQSICRIHRSLTEVLDIREVERPMMVRIHEFPTQPLVGLLGLVGKEIKGDGLGITYAIQPIRPFWMRVTMDEALGEMLWYRSGGGSWRKPDTPVRSYFDEGCTPSVGVGTVERLDTQGDPRRLAQAAIEWHGSAGENLTADLARRAVEVIDAQTVLESILSREWGNWAKSARWLVRRRKLARQLAKLTTGMAGEDQPFLEMEFLAEEPPRRGNLPQKIPAERRRALMRQLKHLADIRKKIEHNWHVLFTLGVQYGEYRKAKATPPDKFYAPFPKTVADLIAGLREMVEGRPMDSFGRPSGKLLATLRGDAATTGDTPRLTALVEEFKTIEHMAKFRLSAEGTLSEATEASIAELAGVVWSSRNDLQDAVALARDRYDLELSAVLNAISRDEQKPDHVVRRDAAGPEAYRVFPLDDSWDERWYAGPPLRAAKPDSPES